MANKFILVFIIVSLWNILPIGGNPTSSNSCPFPPKLKNYYDYNWDSRSDEWINKKSRTDYLILSLSWYEVKISERICFLYVCRSPTFCASLPGVVREREFQCQRIDSFGLVVHGLWPQTSAASSVRDQPRNCRNEQQLPYSIIKRYYCLMPDEDLMQAEWEKHGSCYFSTATDYFDTIEYLYNRLKIPDLRSMQQSTFSTIKNAFVKLNAPKLFASAIHVSMDRQGQLNEIRLCYDLDYNFISCRQ